MDSIHPIVPELQILAPVNGPTRSERVDDKQAREQRRRANQRARRQAQPSAYSIDERADEAPPDDSPGGDAHVDVTA